MVENLKKMFATEHKKSGNQFVNTIGLPRSPRNVQNNMLKSLLCNRDRYYVKSIKIIFMDYFLIIMYLYT